MRDIVKVRSVAGSVIITLPRSFLKQTTIKPGDRVVLDTDGNPNQFTVAKESEYERSKG